MPKFSVCVEMIFRERPFLERIDAVKACGLEAFEFWGWRDKDVAAIAERAAALHMRISSIVLDTSAPLTVGSENGQLLTAAKESLAAAKRLSCPNLITLAGNELADRPRSEQHRNVVKGLKTIAPLAEEAGVTILLEPLNILVDHKGYYLSTSAEGFEIVSEVNNPAVKLLFDIYHQQITEGNLLSNIMGNLAQIGHFHVADVPGRHEPGTGEINYRNIFAAIDQAGYTGYFGLEFMPKQSPQEALRQTLDIAGLL